MDFRNKLLSKDKDEGRLLSLLCLLNSFHCIFILLWFSLKYLEIMNIFFTIIVPAPVHVSIAISFGFGACSYNNLCHDSYSYYGRPESI